MTRPHLAALTLLALCLLAAGCGPTPAAGGPPALTPAATGPRPTATATFLPPPTVTPYPTATPGGEAVLPATGEAGPRDGGSDAPGAGPRTGVAVGEQIFYSTFDSGWPTVEEEGVAVFLERGGYVFALGRNAMSYANTTSVNAANTYTEVEVTPETCPAGGGYGLFFRFRDTGNYYALTVFCDRRVTVFTRVNGALVPEAIVDVTLPAGLDPAASSAHTIGVLARGSSFALYFDGQSVTTFTDNRHSQGDVAVYAVSPQRSELRVTFDNLGVWIAN